MSTLCTAASRRPSIKDHKGSTSQGDELSMEQESELGDRHILIYQAPEEIAGTSCVAFKPAARSTALYFPQTWVRDPGLDDVFHGRATATDGSGGMSRTASSAGHNKHGGHGADLMHATSTQVAGPVVLPGAEADYVSDFMRWEAGMRQHATPEPSPFSIQSSSAFQLGTH
jgi:hypothetical protein